MAEPGHVTKCLLRARILLPHPKTGFLATRFTVIASYGVLPEAVRAFRTSFPNGAPVRGSMDGLA